MGSDTLDNSTIVLLINVLLIINVHDLAYITSIAR